MNKLLFVAVMLFVPASLSQDCPNNQCMMYCEHGFEQDDNGCDICQCRPPPHEVHSDACDDVTCDAGLVCKSFKLTSSRHVVTRCVDPYIPSRCQPPMDAGPCKKSEEKWFYNTDSGKCEKFLFGGCRGNLNNYDSETQCRLRCIPEIEPGEPGECPIYKCEECQSGYKQNQYGCPTCVCVDPSVDCPQNTCYLSCEHGFVKDIRGCDTCHCAPNPELYSDPCENKPICYLHCNHGLKKDQDGCDMCECRNSPPCANIQCNMQCDYGFAKSRDGCLLCECAPNPCKAVTCPEEHFCEPKLNGSFWEPTCIAFHQAKPWCMGKPMCAIFCENGFHTDQYGCNKCECLEGPAACLRLACTPAESCPFGNKYDSKGCKTCECLPDPCEMQPEDCSAQGKDVCEAVQKHDNCATCPAAAECLFSREVRQVKIRLEYAHDPVEDHLNYKQLQRILKDHIEELMDVDDDYIKGFRAWEMHDSAVAVEYYIITYGDKDLVQVTEKFIYDIENQELHVTYEETHFVPQQSTVSHRYYSKHSYPDEYDEASEEDDSEQIIIVGAVVAGVVVAVVVIIVVIFVVTRSKGKNKNTTQNAKRTYKQVPSSSADQQDTKKQAPVGDVIRA